MSVKEEREKVKQRAGRHHCFGKKALGKMANKVARPGCAVDSCVMKLVIHSVCGNLGDGKGTPFGQKERSILSFCVRRSNGILCSASNMSHPELSKRKG